MIYDVKRVLFLIQYIVVFWKPWNIRYNGPKKPIMRHTDFFNILVYRLQHFFIMNLVGYILSEVILAQVKC